MCLASFKLGSACPYNLATIFHGTLTPSYKNQEAQHRKTCQAWSFIVHNHKAMGAFRAEVNSLATTVQAFISNVKLKCQLVIWDFTSVS